MFHETTALYDIPLNHLDFAYITDCNKLKELEKILKVLRSGSEGRFLELEKHCEEKIRSLDPENRLLRKPGSLLSAYQLPAEEREGLECAFREWLDEMKMKECLSSNACKIDGMDEDEEDELIPKVRQWGSINAETGKGTRVKPAKVKSTKLRTYEEWDKIGKEIEKELEMDENKGDMSSGDFKNIEVAKPSEEMNSDVVKSGCAGLRERVRNMPHHIRAVNAQREKEKGNEALIAGDYMEALGYYERSLIYESTPAVYNNRALLYLKQKKWRLAVEDCNRVLGEEPKNIKALLRRAQALYELHSLEKAQRDLKFLLELEPKNSRAAKLLKDVKEDHASRQKSNLEGGRRMVIDEVEEDSEEDGKDEGHAEAEEPTTNGKNPKNFADARMPPIKRGVEIEEIFDEESDQKDSVFQRMEQTQQVQETGARPREKKSQVEKAVLAPILGETEREYSKLIQELQRTEASKLKSALDVKLDVQLLEQYIFALESVSLPNGDYEFIFKSLDIISRSARFSVAAMMLNESAIKAIGKIVDQLHSSSVITNRNSLEELHSRFSKI